MADPAAFLDWQRDMTQLGGIVTVMPEQAGAKNQILLDDGRRVGKPAVRFTAARVAAINATRSSIGEPSYWSPGKAWGYYLPSDAVIAGQVELREEHSDVKSPGLLSGLLGPDSNIAALGDRLRSLGTVGYWLVIAGAVVGLGIVLHAFNDKARRVAGE